MEKVCFPEIKEGLQDPYNKVSAEWWFVYDDRDNSKGFAGAKMWKPDNFVFLCLSGVLPEARGQGLQKKLINVRIKWAKSQEADGVYTYTSKENIVSANNLIKCGFMLFEPPYKWGLDDGLYWYMRL